MMTWALLARHEAYMADAERDRVELTSRIEQLEMDNKELEAKNAQTIEENRDLLNQLEALNSSVADSDGRIRSLEATLLSSQQIIRRLEGETARAESLERQLAFLEQEQIDLQNTLATTHEEARTAMARWQRAERGILNLQDQLERMEEETRRERDRHAEMIGRMEKQRAVDRELNTAAGRLKGAAAAKSLGTPSGSNVVSHFVRDLLQDNANLQHGIAELREMLMNSNDEIQALREQVLYHQPLPDGDENASTLRAELESKQSPISRGHTPTVSQELHIHHHYHVTPKPETKKPKKKRQVLSAGIFIPPSLPSTPPNASWRTPPQIRSGRESGMSNRWSVLSEQPSEFAPSSVPSSPQSNHHNSLFDTAFVGSMPTSPVTSVDPMSPSWRSHRKQPSNMSARSFQVPQNFALDQSIPSHTHTIMEEGDGPEDIPDLGITTDESAGDDDTSSRDQAGASDDLDIYINEMVSDQGRPRLRRALSHESIVSLSGGLDIHTLKSRPSQLTLRPLSSATSVTASSTVTAQPLLSIDPSKRSSVLLREHYGPSPVGSLPSQSGASGRGSWVGWRPWRGASGGASTPAKPREKDYMRDYGRSPGINQPGYIPGFQQYLAARQKRSPGTILPEQIDQDALREGLNESPSGS
ncbi:hypothetical protein BX600DRAFT_248248 [Xylariales sp. PMI_506]|nr:hypothetical protein BX600DRAFT_248248 [Xylariales sp. PMI_506]